MFQNLPRIVIEAGWSEGFPKLRNDKDLWLIGGANEVQLVILLKWTKLVRALTYSRKLRPCGLSWYLLALGYSYQIDSS